MQKITLLVLLGARLALGLTTDFVDFDHPDGWKCERPQKVWICQSTAEPDRAESLVLAIAAVASDWDKLDNYEEFLKQSRTIEDEDGKPLNSEVRYVRKRNINGTVWVDSLQLNSELPGFWTRYVATVHNTPKINLAILITYIVSEERYSTLAPQFERMVASLKPKADININVSSHQGTELPGSDRIGAITQDILNKRLKKKKDKDSGKKEIAPAEGGDSSMLYIIAGAIAVVAILILRIRRRKAQQKTPIEPGSSPPQRTGTD